MKKIFLNVGAVLGAVAALWLLYHIWYYADFQSRRANKELTRWKMEWASRR